MLKKPGPCRQKRVFEILRKSKTPIPEKEAASQNQAPLAARSFIIKSLIWAQVTDAVSRFWAFRNGCDLLHQFHFIDLHVGCSDHEPLDETNLERCIQGIGDGIG